MFKEGFIGVSQDCCCTGCSWVPNTVACVISGITALPGCIGPPTSMEVIDTGPLNGTYVLTQTEPGVSPNYDPNLDQSRGWSCDSAQGGGVNLYNYANCAGGAICGEPWPIWIAGVGLSCNYDDEDGNVIQGFSFGLGAADLLPPCSGIDLFGLGYWAGTGGIGLHGSSIALTFVPNSYYGVPSNAFSGGVATISW